MITKSNENYDLFEYLKSKLRELAWYARFKNVEDLTDEEKIALAMVAGAELTFEKDTIKSVHKIGFRSENGVIKVFIGGK